MEKYSFAARKRVRMTGLMKLLGAFLCLLMATLVQAQTTWQGLSFGASRQQVRDQLSPKGFSLQATDNANTYVAEPDFEVKTTSPTLAANLKPPPATAPMFFTPELSFDAQGKLQAIKLSVDQAKVLAATPALKPLALLPYVAGTSVWEQLVGKYGSPSTRRGPCGNPDVASLIGTIQECNAKWNGEGQTIDLFWSWSGLIGRPEKFALFVLYSSSEGSAF